MDKPRPISFSEIAFSEKSKEFVDFVEGRVSTGLPRFTSASSSSVLMPIAIPSRSRVWRPRSRRDSRDNSNPLDSFRSQVSGAARVTPLKTADDKTLAGTSIIVPLVVVISQLLLLEPLLIVMGTASMLLATLFFLLAFRTCR